MVENQDDKEKEKSRKVFRIQVKQQYKYKSVRAQILLNKNFENKFSIGTFRICISKNFIRWYDAKDGLKTRQERDRWQLVRDLTNKKMEQIHQKIF
ncbi:hypothetical protein C1646_813248 [Rhizophagus diaphanus]|nr:hypothetical protein C1646_813248 [Rhizophagus diaphanus] [Rhizophagus sp. MUCL 43196]